MPEKMKMQIGMNSPQPCRKGVKVFLNTVQDLPSQSRLKEDDRNMSAFVKHIMGVAFLLGACSSLGVPLDTWATRYVGHQPLRQVACGNGLFAATSLSGPALEGPGGIWISSDGVCWKALKSDLGFLGIAYGQGKFVGICVRHPGSFLAVSTNCVDWTPTSDLSDVPSWPEYLNFSGGRFLVLRGQSLLSSSNGLAWSCVATNVPEYAMAAIYAAGRYVIAGRYGLMATTLDGEQWTTMQQLSRVDFYDVAYGKDLFVAVGSAEVSPGTFEAFITTSKDGVEWTEVSAPASGYLVCVTYGNGMFAAAAGGSIILTSADTIAWQLRTIEYVSGGLADIVYGNGSFLAVGGRSGRAVQSGGRPQICVDCAGVDESGFRLRVTAEENLACSLQVASNLASAAWIDLQDFVGTGGPIELLDGAAGGDCRRFYRVFSP